MFCFRIESREDGNWVRYCVGGWGGRGGYFSFIFGVGVSSREIWRGRVFRVAARFK